MAETRIAILFKEEDSRYTSALKAANVSSVFRPVLSTELLPPAELKPEDYSAVVLTSVRAVSSLAQHLHSLEPDAKQAWQVLPCYGLGTKTADAAKRELLVTQVHGEGTKNASELAAVIVAHHRSNPFVKPVLFLCGDSRLDELPTTLVAKEVPFAEHCVYRTSTPPELLAPAAAEVVHQALLGEEAAAAALTLVFFSPSGVEALVPYVTKSLAGFSSTRLRLVALGATTAAAIAQALPQDHFGAAVICERAVCSAPTPEAVAEAICFDREKKRQALNPAQP